MSIRLFYRVVCLADCNIRFGDNKQKRKTNWDCAIFAVPPSPEVHQWAFYTWIKKKKKILDGTCIKTKKKKIVVRLVVVFQTSAYIPVVVYSLDPFSFHLRFRSLWRDQGISIRHRNADSRLSLMRLDQPPPPPPSSVFLVCVCVCVPFHPPAECMCDLFIDVHIKFPLGLLLFSLLKEIGKG